MWKRTKNFLRESDSFGIAFTFRYKKEDKFSTWQGGIITFIIVIIYLFFGIYYFIPFVRKKNFTSFYNTINIQHPNEYMLEIDISSFNFSLDCGNQQQEKINKYFDFRAKYYYKKKNNSSGIYNLIKTFYYNHYDNCTLK